MNCASCKTEVPAGVNYCPACGKPQGNPTSPPDPSPGLSQNIAGMLAYITFIPAIIFLVVEPYNKNKFIRFHAFQSIFFAAATFVVKMGVMIAAFSMPMGMLFWPINGLVGLVFFVAWLLCVVKAHKNEKFKLPILGDLAEQQAEKL